MPVCKFSKSEKVKIFTEKKGFKIMRCDHCGLMFVDNVPHDLSPYYSEGYFKGQTDLDGYVDYESDKVANRINYLKYLGLFEKLLGKKGEMIEIGCATGFFISLAKEQGWKTFGIDISSFAVNDAKAKGLNAVQGIIKDLEKPELHSKFDMAVLFDVIEHVKDPAEDLKIVSQILKKDGLIAIATPDSGSLWARIWGKKWHAFVPPQHLYFFNEKNLTSLLEQNGFQKIYVAHPGKFFRPAYILRTLYSWTGWQIWTILMRWSDKSFLKNWVVPINLGDTLFVVVKKI